VLPFTCLDGDACIDVHSEVHMWCHICWLSHIPGTATQLTSFCCLHQRRKQWAVSLHNCRCLSVEVLLFCGNLPIPTCTCAVPPDVIPLAILDSGQEGGTVSSSLWLSLLANCTGQAQHSNVGAPAPFR
jgi:hypothetical protein